MNAELPSSWELRIVQNGWLIRPNLRPDLEHLTYIAQTLEDVSSILGTLYSEPSVSEELSNETTNDKQLNLPLSIEGD